MNPIKLQNTIQQFIREHPELREKNVTLTIKDTESIPGVVSFVQIKLTPHKENEIKLLKAGDQDILNSRKRIKLWIK